jgi:hypothetical protein
MPAADKDPEPLRHTVDMAGEEVEVFSGRGGEPERAFYEAALREEGITCVAKSSGAVSQHPFTVGPMAEFNIYVASEDENRAREVIQGLQEAGEPVEEDDRDDDEDAETEPEPTASRGLRSLTEREKKWFLYSALILGAASVWFGVLTIRRGGDVSGILAAVTVASGAVFCALAARGPR